MQNGTRRRSPHGLLFFCERTCSDMTYGVGYAHLNENPAGRNVGDCTVRALSKALDQGWYETYLGLCIEGALRSDMPSANATWGAYLRRNGFIRELAPEDVTVAEFARTHPRGTYILALSGHVVCVIDGVLYDTWDSSNEIVLYYWRKG